jgi:hypothetical protein
MLEPRLRRPGMREQRTKGGTEFSHSAFKTEIAAFWQENFLSYANALMPNGPSSRT